MHLEFGIFQEVNRRAGQSEADAFAEGHAPLTTHLFARGDPYLDSDVVFGTNAPPANHGTSAWTPTPANDSCRSRA